MLAPPEDSPKRVTFSGIAAEAGDVAEDPAEGGDLVQDAVVSASRVSLSSDPAQVQESERTQAVLQRHDHDAATAREFRPVVSRVCGAALRSESLHG